MQNQPNNPDARSPADECVHQTACNTLVPVCWVDVDTEDQTLATEEQELAGGIRAGKERPELDSGASDNRVRGGGELSHPSNILAARQRLHQITLTGFQKRLFDLRGGPAHVPKHGHPLVARTKESSGVARRMSKEGGMLAGVSVLQNDRTNPSQNRLARVHPELMPLLRLLVVMLKLLPPPPAALSHSSSTTQPPCCLVMWLRPRRLPPGVADLPIAEPESNSLYRGPWHGMSFVRIA